MYYEYFEKLCEKNNVKPGTVGRATGIETSTLSNWKKGGYTPKLEKMKLIAEYFGVSIDYLVTGKEKEDAPIFNKDHVELIGMYSRLNETQKKAVFDLLRSFLEN